MSVLVDPVAQWAVALIAAGVGWFALPAVVARLPERADRDEDVVPVLPSYADVAAGRRARPVLAGLLVVLWVLPLVTPTDLPDGTYPAYLWLTTVGLALAWVDAHTHKLPDVLTAAAFVGTAVLLTVAVPTGSGGWADLGRAWLAALAMLAAYLAAALIYPAGLGMGDVKLAPSLGLVLGWSGWSVVLLGWFLGFVVGALVGLAVVLVRRASLKTAVPFGPSMLAGAWLALLWGTRLLGWYTGG